MTMNRRSYLGVLGTAGLATTAGCLDSVPGLGDDRTALSAPDQRRGDPIHPIHGEEFPEFSLPDPINGGAVSLSDLKDERAFLMTFIYTSCIDECGTLVRLLQLIQADALERGYDDDLALIAMTFDPETDTEAELRDYAAMFDVDLDAGHFHFLRPESNDEALDLINERFGVPAQLHDEDSSHDEQNHDDENEIHSDHDHGSPGLHYYMLFLVNEQGIVERSYPNVVESREETRPNAIIKNVRTVVE